MEDKRLFAPKKALEEPLRFQKLAEGIVLSRAHKFSTVGYGLVALALLWVLIFNWLPLPLNFRLPWAGLCAYGIGLVFSNYKPDGKPFPRFLWEAFVFLFIYGRRGIWYKGVFIPRKKMRRKG
jgi:Na+/H+ antiporter NhaD/arsenite permease-like protein